MEVKETLVFNRIKTPNMSIDDIAEMFNENRYTDDVGIGFTYVHIEDSSIVANILIKIPSYLQNYNYHENVFEKSVVYIFDEIQIVLDYCHGLLYSTSSIVRFNKAKSLLRKCFKSNVTIENIECSANKMLDKIRLMNWNPFIINLSIKKFIYKADAIGRLTVSINNSEIGEELLSLYSNDITRITVLVESKDFSNFILSIASQNSFTLKSEESEFWSIVNLIKQVL